MATTRNTSFATMLNDYLSYKLLKEELVKRDYLLSNVEKDDGWIGGPLIVPFVGAGASSVSFGALTAADDVAEAITVRGEISTQPEVWGTLLFSHRDLMEHNQVSEKNFLKILPDQIESFMDYLKMVVSLSFTNGSHFATLTADGDASGNITVDRPERFVIGQKVSVDDGDSSPASGYVRTINLDTGVINIYDARSGGSAVNLSGYTVAQSAKVYFVGSQSAGLTSLKSCLLSYANGGSLNLYGVAKTAYPYLQAINVSGSAITASNILEKIFDAWTTVRNKGKGNPNTILMSYKHLGSIMKALEIDKGAYHIVQNSEKVTAYGWTEIMIQGVKGGLKVVAIQELDNDWIAIVDLNAMKIHSNGFFRKRQSPEGNEYFEVRATTGYSYLVDICFFGDLVVSKPHCCGIIHSISY